MDAVTAGFRDFVDAFSGTLLPDDGDLNGAPITRGSYRLACSRWRRKEATDRYRVRGTADLLLLGVGVHFHGVGIWVSAVDDGVGAKFPDRVALKNDPPPAAASFRDNHARNMFAKKAWAAIQFAFPDAEKCDIGVTHLREKT